MTVEKRSLLPPKPTFELASLYRPSNLFVAVDKIVSDQLAKWPQSEDLKRFMAKAGTENPVHYARRCIVFAGLEAWQRAREWEVERATVQENVATIIGAINAIKNGNDTLKRLAKAVSENEAALPRVADPNVVANRIEYFGIFNNLLQATERIETFAYVELDEAAQAIEARDYGRKDVLADQFIGNLARVWRTFFFEHPATSQSGPFVDLADEAWKVLGWGERPSLGKKVLRKATDECWSQIKQFDRYLAGTI